MANETKTMLERLLCVHSDPIDVGAPPTQRKAAKIYNMAVSSEHLPGSVPAELATPDRYPVLNTMRRYGQEASIGTAVAVFFAVLASSESKGPGSILRAALFAGLVGVGVKNLTELNEIIADTLIPQ